MGKRPPPTHLHPSQGLRKRHGPSGGIQFPRTAPGLGGRVSKQGTQGSKQNTRGEGGGGGGEGEKREGEKEGRERGVEGGKAPSKSTRMFNQDVATVPQHGGWMPSPTEQRAPHGIHVPPRRLLPWLTHSEAHQVILQAREENDHVVLALGMRHHPASQTALKKAPARLTQPHTR